MLFIRSAGIIHIALSQSTSDQSAPLTSPDRAAIKVKNNSACFHTEAWPNSKTSLRKSGHFDHESDGWCTCRTSLLTCLGKRRSIAGNELASTNPDATHQFITRSIRCLNLDAVSSFSNQIGFSTSAKSVAVNSSTGRNPIFGNAYVSSVFIHCALCLEFLKPSETISKTSLPASAKVGTVLECALAS